MSYLASATKAHIKPPMLTIVGFPSAGKTTLASLFPKPLIIQAEDSGTVFETWPEDRQPSLLRLIPEKRTRSVLYDQLAEVFESEHDYKTLVLDTTTSLQALLESEIVEAEGGDKSIQDCLGGFQKAYDLIAKTHREVVAKCAKIRARKGMTIVFLAHTDELKRKHHPESPDQYTVYGMRMHKKSRDVYISECDAVIYIKQHDVILGVEKDKKGVQTKPGRVKKSEDRVLITSSDGLVGFVDAKSRYMMPKEIEYVIPDPSKPWEAVNPLLQYIPYYNTKGA